MSKILVVAAHPDDEILGPGATIVRHIANGDSARCLILGEGQTSRWESREKADKKAIEELHKNTLQAAKVIGYEKVYFADFADNRFDHADLLDIVKYVENITKEYQPDIIYTHHATDLNIDHQYTFQAVLTAARPVNDYCVKEIYAFETLSSTEWNFERGKEFVPSIFVDVEKEFAVKQKAMSYYESELCEFPHPRSLEMLEIEAKRWGSIVGKRYVEAFEVIRIVK